MLCDQEGGDTSHAFLKRFHDKIFRGRIPLQASTELTSRCNLGCVHCYVSKGNLPTDDIRPELSAGEWMHLIDQFVDAGSLYFLFSGGEPLLRPDFTEIYSYACRKGLLVTVFTNGTLVTDKILKAFHAYPPHCVDVSIYGATRETYEKVTRTTGSFEKCVHGIFQLKDAGVNLKLKTMALTINSHELNEMRAFASDLGVSFRYDAAVSPRLDGNPEPLSYRVPVEEVIKQESSDQKKKKQWLDLYRRMKELVLDNLYECGAGVSMFHVDACGMMRPCFMVPGWKKDLRNHRFSDIWFDKGFTDFRGPGLMPRICRECDSKVLCGYCPGFFKLETGNEQVPSAYLCETGKYRKQMISDTMQKEEQNVNEQEKRKKTQAI